MSGVKNRIKTWKLNNRESKVIKNEESYAPSPPKADNAQAQC